MAAIERWMLYRDILIVCHSGSELGGCNNEEAAVQWSDHHTEVSL